VQEVMALYQRREWPEAVARLVCAEGRREHGYE